MKCISLWQPWASLIATNWKHYETRGWYTTYRGLLAIHASKHTDDLDYWFAQPEFSRHLKASGIQSFIDLPLGAIVGVVNLVDVFPTAAIRGRLDKTELAFGNYETGRYAWKLEWKAQLLHPVKMQGKPGVFEAAFDWQPIEENENE